MSGGVDQEWTESGELPAPVLLKYCGVRRAEDVEIINQTRPDYMGLVFAPSARQVTAAEARKLVRQLDPGIQAVGVFVNEPLTRLLDTVQVSGVQIVQLHGDEDEFYIQQARELLPGAVFWKAVRVRTGDDIRAAELLPVEGLLLDSFSAQAYGGTGKRAALDTILARPPKKEFMLAGGIRPDNVVEILSRIQDAGCAAFRGLDVSGGIETGGYKDAGKARELAALVRMRGRV